MKNIVQTDDQGRHHGLVAFYDGDDEILQRGFYKHGKRHGLHITYFYGHLSVIATYDNGVMVGERTLYILSSIGNLGARRIPCKNNTLIERTNGMRLYEQEYVLE